MNRYIYSNIYFQVIPAHIESLICKNCNQKKRSEMRGKNNSAQGPRITQQLSFITLYYIIKIENWK